MVRKSAPVNRADKDIFTFGGRLWAERDRLGIKQVDLCKALEISKTTQIQYEANKSRPDVDYLVKISELGFDLVYLLVGERGSAPLQVDHQNLVAAYDAASEELKTAAFAVLLSGMSRDIEACKVVPDYVQTRVLEPAKKGPPQDGFPAVKDGATGEK